MSAALVALLKTLSDRIDHLEARVSTLERKPAVPELLKRGPGRPRKDADGHPRGH